MVFDIWVIIDIFLSWRAIGPNWKGKHTFLNGEVTYRKCESSSVTNKKSGRETGTARRSSVWHWLPTSGRVLLLGNFFCVSFLSNQFSVDVFWVFHLLFHHLFLATLHLLSVSLTRAWGWPYWDKAEVHPLGILVEGRLFSRIRCTLVFYEMWWISWGIAVLCIEH